MSENARKHGRPPKRYKLILPEASLGRTDQFINDTAMNIVVSPKRDSLETLALDRFGDIVDPNRCATEVQAFQMSEVLDARQITVLNPTVRKIHRDANRHPAATRL